MTAGDGREEGAAVVDFVLVSALLTLLFLAVVQLALVLHVRNTLTDAASSGARYGALADRGAEDARRRAVDLISSALGAGYARDVSAAEVNRSGVPVLEVHIKAPLPVIGLIGPSAGLEVGGHAAIQR
ncbi:pilus assembly protein [Paenarthrobacter sp. DKR-5]|uniref:TadE/TadG family type IV pilus assembly protein n=1 Tax=Paenarthrobacter sp. DKR-5 TaxID=2835535 RepID=UPI001BDBD6B3|nr:TadE family protein [Paenarthrobacter sp. DKR-5]MBT1003048.1 pilus assembly protein [Paenarthrobacter sp. DKR-5]